jgi:hypothetical protein
MSMIEYDDPFRLRQEDLDDFEELARALLSRGDTASVTFLARTVSGGSYPTAAQRFYKLEAGFITAPATEGGAAAITWTGVFRFAYNHGTAIPPVGTLVLVAFTPYRWLFSYS